MSIKSWSYKNLEPNQLMGKELSFLNIIFVFLIIVSVFVQVIETDEEIFIAHQQQFLYADLFFAIIFTIETSLRVWCYTENHKYSGENGRIKYLLTPASIIDILTLIPFYITIGEASWMWGALRTTKILSIAKYSNITDALKILMSSVARRRYELFVTVMLFLFLMLTSATLLYIVEHKAQPEAFGSIAKSLWWAIVTLTAVGYGDTFPITDWGKFYASLTMLLGVGVFAMPTGILAAAFSHAFQKNFEEKVLDNLKYKKEVLNEIKEDLVKKNNGSYN